MYIILYLKVTQQRLLQFGTPEAIKDEINRLKKEMAVGGGYILAAAKMMGEEIPVENAAAVFEGFL